MIPLSSSPKSQVSRTRRRGLRVSLLPLALLLTFGTVAAHAEPARVKVDAGTLVGASNGTIESFKGVPYVKPPVGPLRWRPPQPAAPWPGERDATAFGPSCPQANSQLTPSGTPPSTSEDCLTLNVWAPAHAERPLPVMVWLHGGANSIGAGSQRYYDGTAFARDGVVLVTLNYRLGPLGFFAHPALSREAAPGEPLGNYGLMDQIAALAWVQTNIRAFGGDPGRVTLFGESAGGQDTLALMTTPAAAQKFQQAIVESGLGWSELPALAQAEESGVEAAALLGISSAAAGAPSALATGPKDELGPMEPATAALTAVAARPGKEGATAASDASLVQRLRAVPVEALVKLRFRSEVIVDGRLLRENPALAFAQDRAAHVPLIIGTNSDEGSLMGEVMSPDAVLSTLKPDDVARARAVYGTGTNDAQLARALFRDRAFFAPARWIASRAAATAPAFLYRFSYVRQSQRRKIPGAGHGSEIPYVFDSWSQSPGGGSFLAEDDRSEATKMHALWIAFAKTGTPAAPGVPAWPPYRRASDELLELGPETAVRHGLDAERLDPLESRVLRKEGWGTPPR